MDAHLINQLAQRVELLLARHEALLHSQALLQEQIARLTHERDQLLAQCQQARQRLQTLIAALQNSEAEA